MSILTMNRLSILRRYLSLCETRFKTSSISSSSSNKLDLSMKKFIELKEYQKALDLFDQQSHLCTTTTITMALKACIKSYNYQCGVNIHQQLSPHLLNNCFIQTTLIEFYSESFISIHASNLLVLFSKTCPMIKIYFKNSTRIKNNF
jgi:hypothetical protein